MSKKVSIIVAFVIVFTALSTYGAEKTLSIKLKTKFNNSTANEILPSKIPTMILSDIDSMPGAIQFNPIIKDKNKLTAGDIYIGNNSFYFLLETNRFRENKKFKTTIYMPPISDKLSEFWVQESKLSSKEIKKLAPLNIRLKLFLSGKSNDNKGKKKTAKKTNTKEYRVADGKLKKNKHYRQGYSYPIPSIINSKETKKLYNAIISKPSATFFIYDSEAWTKGLKKRGLKTKVALIFPRREETQSWGYLKSITTLTCKINNSEIILYDDNLNNIYAEKGIDSIKIGENCISTIGSKICIKDKVYTINEEIKRSPKSNKNTLNLTMVSVKTGKVQVKLAATNAEMLLAQLKNTDKNNDDDFYPMFGIKGNSGTKKIKHYLSVTIPEGKYTIAGGMIKLTDKDSNKYAFFAKGGKFTVRAGKTTIITIGEPLTTKITVEPSSGERTILCSYPKGASGEEYRLFIPKPKNTHLTIKSENKNAYRPIFKNMKLTDDDNIFLKCILKYNSVLMSPDIGPFKISIDIDPIVFKKRTVSVIKKKL